MIFHICAKCKKIVWFWQSSGAIDLNLKSGKKKRIHLCFDCAQDLMLKALKAEEKKP
jgi:hypothetical protein